MEVLDDDDGGGGEGGGGGGGGISSGDSPDKKDEDKDKNKDREKERKEKDKSKEKEMESSCRLRGVGSRSSLSVAAPVKTAPVHHRPSKPCCFCWCCCCTCSWNKCQSFLQVSTCLAVKGNNTGCRKRKESGAPEQTTNNCETSEPPPSLEEIRCWGNSFDKLMRNPAGRKVFREFLRCEYSEENILFWLACEELKREGNPDVIEEKARFIYEDYISILSPKEVSLDSRVREIVNRNMVSPTPHTFDEAQLQIYTLMHRDSYPRFVNSPLYKQLAQLYNGDSGSDGASGAEAKSSSAQ